MFANIPPLIWVHFIATLVALPLGLQQLVGQKGGAGHRLGGRVYIIAMLLALLSALASFKPETRFLPFHILAIVGLTSLTQGTLALRRWLQDRQPAALRQHKISMAFSWLGLAMAGVSQITSNPRFGIVGGMPPAQFWTVLALTNAAMMALGVWWVFGRLVRD